MELDQDQLQELLLQSLEHEIGGVKLYEAALRCAVNEDLKEEWQKYLSQTRNHVEVLTRTFETFGLDPQQQSPGRKLARQTGAGLLGAIEQAEKNGDPAAAQIVAAEVIVLAETKDHLDWELLGECAKALQGERAKALQAAYDEIEDEEDEHLYHTKGWCRELWLESLGMKAQLPPPEERLHVKTAIDAARVEQSRSRH